MVKIIQILVFIAFSVIVNAQISAPEWLNGAWQGLGYQPENNSKWEVLFKFEEKTQKAIIEYPSLKCSGNWILQTATEDKVVFMEIITGGIKNCLDGSKVVVTRIDDEYINIAWFSGKNEKMDAFAALSHKEINWLNGNWTGIGYQTDTKSTWTVDFTYDGSSCMASIKYPSLKCGGKWKLVSIDGVRAEFTEDIEYGLCVDGSKVIVTLIDDKHISIAWLSEHIPGIDAYSVLIRK